MNTTVKTPPRKPGRPSGTAARGAPGGPGPSGAVPRPAAAPCAPAPASRAGGGARAVPCRGRGARPACRAAAAHVADPLHPAAARPARRRAGLPAGDQHDPGRGVVPDRQPAAKQRAGVAAGTAAAAAGCVRAVADLDRAAGGQARHAAAAGTQLRRRQDRPQIHDAVSGSGSVRRTRIYPVTPGDGPGAARRPPAVLRLHAVGRPREGSGRLPGGGASRQRSGGGRPPASGRRGQAAPPRGPTIAAAGLLSASRPGRRRHRPSPPALACAGPSTAGA